MERNPLIDGRLRGGLALPDRSVRAVVPSDGVGAFEVYAALEAPGVSDHGARRAATKTGDFRRTRQRTQRCA
jgi:hypothetical protein